MFWSRYASEKRHRGVTAFLMGLFADGSHGGRCGGNRTHIMLAVTRQTSYRI